MFENYLEELKDTSEIMEILKKISILGGLRQEHLEEIFQLAFKAKLPKNYKLFSIDESASYIYILIKGSISLIFFSEENKEECMILKTGDCFGEASLIAIEAHTASALCIEDCELVVLSRKALMSLHKKNPDLFGRLILNIARELARSLHKTNKLLFEYKNHKIKSRYK